MGEKVPDREGKSPLPGPLQKPRGSGNAKPVWVATRSLTFVYHTSKECSLTPGSWNRVPTLEESAKQAGLNMCERCRWRDERGLPMVPADG